MTPCQTVEDGVRAALRVYEHTPTVDWKFVPAGSGEYTDRLILGGEEYPLFWWRENPQIRSLYALAPARHPVSMKLNRVCEKNYGLDCLILKEIDIATYLLRDEIVRVYGFRNGNSANFIADFASGIVAQFELAATLCPGSEEQGRHSVWGRDGMASDRVVSQKVAAAPIYLFTPDKTGPTTYNDEFIYMYGLSKSDVSRATMIARILMGQIDVSDWNERERSHFRVLDALRRSFAEGVEVKIDGEEES